MVCVATGHPTVKRNGGAVEHCTEASDKAMESWSGDNDAMTTEVVPTEHPSMTKAIEEEQQRNSEQRDLARNCAALDAKLRAGVIVLRPTDIYHAHLRAHDCVNVAVKLRNIGAE
ncbi:hypothetical protein B0H14DRAFT_2606528 [Mycena olivaceomarginata]|nr:hypothetical protein B0H14DRAFT_2606528 [Mycena olivaceomarginata]